MPIATLPSSRRPSLTATATVPTLIIPDVYSDSRTHGHQGSTKHARLPKVAAVGGGLISKGPDGERCVVAGNQYIIALRILRMSNPGVEVSNSDHKSIVGRGGYRIDASRNMWKGSGLKSDSTTTDVVWTCGEFSNKILTSARNGELIMWDLNKSGPSKYERRTRDHLRAIHMIGYSAALRQYCVTCSMDGELRVWDLRDLRKSIMRIRQMSSIRTVAASPLASRPMQVFTGLDNGTLFRWDLDMAQRGQLAKIPLAHNGNILTMDWSLPTSVLTAKVATTPVPTSTWLGGVGSGFFEDLTVGGTNPQITYETEGGSMGWLATGGLDRCVKVWDLSSVTSDPHMSKTPTYTLHTSYPIRKVLWRPGAAFECELAVVSNADTPGSGSADSASPSVVPSPHMTPSLLPTDLRNLTPVVSAPLDEKSVGSGGSESPSNLAAKNGSGDPVEVWDVRRGYVAKWRVRGSAIEGGATDIAFGDPYTIWTQHASGSFSQFDLRQATRPIDAIPRISATWDVSGSMVFVADKPKKFEIPFDDIHPERRQATVERKGKVKILGDKSYQITSQTVGQFSGVGLTDDIEVFVKLAEGYVYEGEDRASICAHNAEVALDAGKPEAAQSWLLLESLLTDLVTPTHTTATTPALSPLPNMHPLLPQTPSTAALHSVAPSSATVIANSYSSRTTSFDFDHPQSAKKEKGSPGSLSRRSFEKFASGGGYLSPQRITPTSSTASSPRRPTHPLPASMLAKRGSISGASSIPPPRPRLYSSSHHRRPSINAASIHSTAPSESSTKSGPLSASFREMSLKDVGDGALSDDDDEMDDCPSDDGRSDGHSIGQSGNDSYYYSGSSHQPSIASSKGTIDIPVSPFLYPHSRSIIGPHVHPTPSPLSRVAGKHDWTEDEGDEEGDSPSPPLTDESDDCSTDEDANSVSRRDVKGKGVQRSKPRTRGKGVTSPRLPSASILNHSHSARPPKLTKQESSSSIRTVTAINSPLPDSEKSSHRDARRNSGGIRERDFASYSASASFTVGKPDPPKPSTASFLSRGRLRSSLSADFTRDVEGRICRVGNSIDRYSTMATPVARGKSVEEEQAKEVERRLRDIGWQSMRESIEVLADEGDIQMCTMLSLVAPEELKITKSRLIRFLEAYIDILVRLRLHTTAAYMRKYAPVEDVRSTTSLETTIYTSCGKCGRPMIRPATGRQLTTTPITSTTPLDGHDNGMILKPRTKPKPNGSYGFCLSCRESSTSCSICHLPVRALLFKCPVCMHGGHQSCYQNYYMRKPLIETMNPQPVQPPQPPTRPSPRGRTLSKNVDPEMVDDSGSKDIDEDVNVSAPKVVGPYPLIYGHACAAGCGHYCWATNELSYARVVD